MKQLSRLIVFASVALALSSPAALFAQTTTLETTYCSSAGTCGLPGNQAPILDVPRGLQSTDLLGRRYGPGANEFIQSVQGAKQDVAQIKQALGSLNGTPYSLDANALGKKVLDYFSDASLMQNLSSAYAAPTAPPAGGLPPSVGGGFDAVWKSLADGNDVGLAKATIAIRGLQSQARAFEQLGGPYTQTSQYISDELHRNFTDASGVLRHLVNSQSYQSSTPLKAGTSELQYRAIDGINRLILSDFALRSSQPGASSDHAAAVFGASAQAYRIAAAISLTDTTAARKIISALDISTRAWDSFAAGVYEQGASSLKALLDGISHPISTIAAIGSAIKNYDATAKLISSKVKDKYAEFVAGTVEVRSKIVGEIAFEAATLYVGVGEIKYGAGTIEVSTDAAKLAVLQEFAATARTTTLGGALQRDALDGLKLLEEADPQAAIQLYTGSAKHAEEIGLQIRNFAKSSSDFAPVQTGEEFLASHPEVLGDFSQRLASTLTTFDSGGSVNIYVCVAKSFTDEMLANGLKGPTFKEWAEVSISEGRTYGNRFGIGRYVSMDRDAVVAEVQNYAPATHDILSAEFSPVANGGKGYVYSPSVRKPGAINIFDGSLDNFGAFKNAKKIP